MLVKPKDKTPTDKQCGAIYQITCPKCDLQYIGETARSIGQRLKEHVKTDINIKSAIGEHIQLTGHPITIDNVKVLGREAQWHTRKIKEAIEIKTHKPALNRDGGYELPAIYNNFWSRDNSTNHVTNELPSALRTVE